MTIHLGDCVEVMRTMPADSVDAVVTDPPAAIGFMSKSWDRDKGGRTEWVAWMTEVMRECYRVLKPGGYAVVWSLPRTCHWTAWAMEDAGFIIRDQLAHIFASGFPKGKAQLKPAREDWWLARKPGPLRPLGIDAGRIPGEPYSYPNGPRGNVDPTSIALPRIETPVDSHPAGRWPSNLLLSDPALFDEPNPEVVGSGATTSSSEFPTRQRKGNDGEVLRESKPGIYNAYQGGGFADSGGYSRFFLVPKSSRADREPVVRGSNAVYCNCKTVKPESWERQGQSPPAPTSSTSPRKGTSGAPTMADTDSSTTLFGNSTSEPSPQETRSITSTGTSSTTESRTSSPSIPSPTNGSTPGASSSTASGGSDAPFAPSTDRSTPSGGTSRGKGGRSTVDAAPATSLESSPTRRCAACGREVKPSNGGPVEAADGVAGARRNSHPT